MQIQAKNYLCNFKLNIIQKLQRLGRTFFQLATWPLLNLKSYYFLFQTYANPITNGIEIRTLNDSFWIQKQGLSDF